MKFTEALRKSTVPTVGGLLLGGYLASLLFAFWLQMMDGASLREWVVSPLFALIYFLFAMIFAVPTVIITAWPVYSFLLSRNIATYFSSITIAIVFATAVWFVDPLFGRFTLLYGICIALVVHNLQVRSNRKNVPGPVLK